LNLAQAQQHNSATEQEQKQASLVSSKNVSGSNTAALKE